MFGCVGIYLYLRITEWWAAAFQVVVCYFMAHEHWCRGYSVDTVGKNEKKIREYIQNQLEEDYVKDQVIMKEYMDSFTGEKIK